jgi:hypothetical protein
VEEQVDIPTVCDLCGVVDEESVDISWGPDVSNPESTCLVSLCLVCSARVLKRSIEELPYYIAEYLYKVAIMEDQVEQSKR